MERSLADPFFALGPRLVDALLDADEPERHHDDEDEKPLRQEIETEREMQEAVAIEPGERGDGDDDGNEHDGQNADGEDQRLNLVADARGVLAHGTFYRQRNPPGSSPAKTLPTGTGLANQRGTIGVQSWQGGDYTEARKEGECLRSSRNLPSRATSSIWRSASLSARRSGPS